MRLPLRLPLRGADGAGTETQGGGTLLKCKHGNIVIVECLLDKFRDAAGKFIHIQNVGDLRADLTHQIQLIEPEAFHRDTMRGDQTHCHRAGESFEQIQFALFEFRTFFAGDLKRSQRHPLLDQRDRSPGGALSVTARDARSAAFGALRTAAALCCTCPAFRARCIPGSSGSFRKNILFFKVWQAEDFFIEPDIHISL